MESLKKKGPVRFSWRRVKILTPRHQCQKPFWQPTAHVLQQVFFGFVIRFQIQRWFPSVPPRTATTLTLHPGEGMARVW